MVVLEDGRRERILLRKTTEPVQRFFRDHPVREGPGHETPQEINSLALWIAVLAREILPRSVAGGSREPLILVS